MSSSSQQSATISARDRPSGTRERRVVVLFACLLPVLFGLWANLDEVRSLGMHRNPPGWQVDAIAPVISGLYFGHAWNYTGLVDVRDRFLSRVTGHDSATLNAAIASTLATDPGSVSREYYLLGSDDKGVVDFVALSFLIFGKNVEGFLYTYFLILAISTLAFVVHFWNKPWALFLMASFYAAHLAFLPTVFLNLQLKSVIALRFMPVASMIACLHIVIAVLRWRLTGKQIALVVLQACVVIFVIHVRSSAVWQVGAVGVALLVVVACRGCAQAPPLRRFAMGAWPLAALVVGLVGLNGYQKVAYAPEYHRGDQILGHVFWHSFYSGLAFHPELARRFELKIDDVSIVRATGRFLIARGRGDEW